MEISEIGSRVRIYFGGNTISIFPPLRSSQLWEGTGSRLTGKFEKIHNHPIGSLSYLILRPLDHRFENTPGTTEYHPSDGTTPQILSLNPLLFLQNLSSLIIIRGELINFLSINYIALFFHLINSSDKVLKLFQIFLSKFSWRTMIHSTNKRSQIFLQLVSLSPREIIVRNKKQRAWFFALSPLLSSPILQTRSRRRVASPKNLSNQTFRFRFDDEHFSRGAPTWRFHYGPEEVVCIFSPSNKRDERRIETIFLLLLFLPFYSSTTHN